MTSHDVVAWARRFFGQKRIGHTGTLDPGAAGVLPLCLGTATRLVEYLSEHGKEYRAQVAFGSETDTADADGQVIATGPVEHLTQAAVASALERFRGEIEQVPPAAAAVKIRGEPLYRRLRRGEAVEAPSRRVTLDRLEMLEFTGAPDASAWLDISCSKGTYIRSLARDLGLALGSRAHLRFLLRTRSGPFRLDQAWTAEELEELGREEAQRQALIPSAQALSDWPAVQLDADQAAALRSCGALEKIAAALPAEPAGGLWRAVHGDDLIAILTCRLGHWSVEKVFPEGQS